MKYIWADAQSVWDYLLLYDLPESESNWSQTGLHFDSDFQATNWCFDGLDNIVFAIYLSI